MSFNVLLKMKILPAVTFVLGSAVGGVAISMLGPGSHAREETKMAFINRDRAIEQGDGQMKQYFEEVITWNAVMHLSPRFFEEPYGGKIDWLDDTPADGEYRRIKDGVTYSELLSIAKERQAFGPLPSNQNQAEQGGGGSTPISGRVGSDSSDAGGRD